MFAMDQSACLSLTALLITELNDETTSFCVSAIAGRKAQNDKASKIDANKYLLIVYCFIDSIFVSMPSYADTALDTVSKTLWTISMFIISASTSTLLDSIAYCCIYPKP